MPELIAISSEFLGRTLRPKYYVRIEQRVYISDENDSGRTVMVPDLRITHRPGQGGPAFARAAALRRPSPSRSTRSP